MQLYYGVQATVSVIRNSDVVRYSGASTVAIYIMYGVCSRCMQQCPLFGRHPLLGVSVNRESTVLRFMGQIIYRIYGIGEMGLAGQTNSHLTSNYDSFHCIRSA